MHEQIHCHGEAANHQLPIVMAFWVIQIVSVEGGVFKLNEKFDADLLLYSVILNVMATHYTCSLNGIYHPHWLVQWSHHCSHMWVPVHCPWLPGYIDIPQTVLIILTTAGIFLDRPHTWKYTMGSTFSLCFTWPQEVESELNDGNWRHKEGLSSKQRCPKVMFCP